MHLVFLRPASVNTPRSRPFALASLLKTGLAGGAVAAVMALNILSPFYPQRDLYVDYLAALALRDGLPPFTPLVDLQTRYLPNVAAATYEYGNYHPPVLWLSSLPLTLLPFPAALLLWTVMSALVVVVVGRWLKLSVGDVPVLWAWPPVLFTLYVSQYELFILACAMLAWRAAAAGRDGRAGLWLGLAAAMKFYPALFVVPFLVRRRWKVVFTSALVFGCGQALNLAVLGPGGMVDYWRGLSVVEHRWILPSWGNSAPYGALLRLLGGSPEAQPLLEAPQLVLPLSVLISAAALLTLLRMRPTAAPVAALVAMPNMVWYCAVLALPQIVALWRSQACRPAVLLATAAASFALPLANLVMLVLTPLGQALNWPLAVMMTVLAAVQPLGYVALLILSLKVDAADAFPEAAAT